jgi:hypothetical protein
MVRLRALGLAALLATLAGCDLGTPPEVPLVVEGFAESARPLPPIRVGRAGALGDTGGRPVETAEVVVRVGGTSIPYAAEPGAPGRYRPLTAFTLLPGDAFSLEVRAEGLTARAASTAPPLVRLDSARAVPSEAPVRAVFADSLGAPLREGFLYPVDVTLYWTAPPSGEWWVRARLAPPDAFPSAVVDFLLRTDDTRSEADLAADPARPGLRRWRGLYAVPVPSADAPLPPHALEVALLRSGLDYALYARSRTEPDRREPIGNVEGGVGIFAGISVARLTLAVE